MKRVRATMTRHATACSCSRKSPLQLLVSCGLAVFVSVGLAGDSVLTGNILTNGAFDVKDSQVADRPAGWFLPDGLGVQWLEDPDAPERGKCIRIDTRVSEKKMVERWKAVGISDTWDIPEPADNAVAATYGLSYYSDTLPVASGQAYRVTFDFKGRSGAKVWVRSYGLFKGRMRRRYEKVVNCTDTGGKWQTFSDVLHPTRLRPEISEMKVMLYAFWPAGVYWFDNVQLQPISAEEYQREK